MFNARIAKHLVTGDNQSAVAAIFSPNNKIRPPTYMPAVNMPSPDQTGLGIRGTGAASGHVPRAIAHMGTVRNINRPETRHMRGRWLTRPAGISQINNTYLKMCH